jgi:uncharacterized protein
MKNYNYWVDKLGLHRHPEGGFYKQIYKASENISASALPDRFNSDHAYSTSIYYLLIEKDFSAFHKINQDEVWHFYTGSSLTVHIIDNEGKYSIKKVGLSPEVEEYPQAVVDAGCWFAAEINNKKSYSLVGCTVAPGFEFTDFILAERNSLTAAYPKHKDIIEKFTRI